MGLDFSHCGASWSYSGFHSFRCRLADDIGIDMGQMVGFGGNRPWTDVKDSIVPLLDHSDCDGELTPEECAKVAPRLRDIVAFWPDDYDKHNALELADAMTECAAKGENLEFR